ncbi:MAG: 1,2-phenylacetyl-CoA epoxidase subunit PaaD [Xanthomonadales bacterium]|nr:1,2-phenylacetyl-CoA epoxidase subunit PaaD [Xanthomonadales bacterium]
MNTAAAEFEARVPQTVIEALEAVVDPEIPVLTIRDLGVLRGVRMEDEAVVVTITPTYSGCPAMVEIRENITMALKDAGVDAFRIETRLAPAWTTDWMSEEGRKKLLEYGIAPPQRNAPVSCPQCKSADTQLVSEFGSTACKALYQCKACLEPFDHFKCH